MSDPAAIPPTTIALGGETLSVRLADGALETVKVRLVPIAEYPAFFGVVNNELRLAEFVCDKPEGWAATLLPDSLMDIVERGTDLNFSPARRWAERRAKIDEASLPLADKMESFLKQISANSALTAVLRSVAAPPPR